MVIKRRGIKGLTLVLATAAGLAVSGSALADKVYKWVDEAGVTHYGEAAPKGKSSTAVKVTDTASSDADSEIERLEKSRQAQREARAEAEDSGSTTEKPRGVTPPAAGTEDANTKACAQNRKNLETLKNGGRIRVLGEGGKSRPLTPEEAKAQIEFAESEVKRCEGLEKIKAASSQGK